VIDAAKNNFAIAGHCGRYTDAATCREFPFQLAAGRKRVDVAVIAAEIKRAVVGNGRLSRAIGQIESPNALRFGSERIHRAFARKIDRAIRGNHRCAATAINYFVIPFHAVLLVG
jgi:hypothetical protein